jgi:hypothetical protein
VKARQRIKQHEIDEGVFRDELENERSTAYRKKKSSYDISEFLCDEPIRKKNTKEELLSI